MKFDSYETRRFVEFYLNSIDLAPYISGGAQPKLNQKNLNRIEIPLPGQKRQKYIVDILDRFDAICNDLTSGLPAEIEARQKQYEYYRDKLLSFKELTCLKYTEMRAEFLPICMVRKNFIQGEIPSYSYEDYLRDFVNCSEYFLKKSNEKPYKNRIRKHIESAIAFRNNIYLTSNFLHLNLKYMQKQIFRPD